MRKHFETELNNQRRNLDREKELQETNHSILVKRLKNELLDKNQEIDALSKKVYKGEEIHSSELEHLKRQKESLLSDIANAEVNHLNAVAIEKAKLRQINEQEI